MRQEKKFRSNMARGYMTAVILPVLLLAIGSQIVVKNWADQSLQFEVNSSLYKSEECLDMTLDKFDTILYDFCTDDEVVEFTRSIRTYEEQEEASGEINAGTVDAAEAAFTQLRRKLSHVCNRTDGVEGISMKIASGSVMFYDRIASSSDNTTWAKDVEFPVVDSGEIYQIAENTVKNAGKTVHFFQIARRIVNYENVKEDLGTVVISINSTELSKALKNANQAKTYLHDGDRIICAPDVSEIGRELSITEKSGYLVKDEYNEISGYTLRNMQPLSGYYTTILRQLLIFVAVVVFSMFLVLVVLYHTTRPAIIWVEKLDAAMRHVSRGEYDVRIPKAEYFSEEMNQINESFNEAARQTQLLLSRSKEAVMEQKNAELNALEAQIDPHFLYNTLDTINWKAIEDEEYEISEMVGALADILRYSVKNAGAEVRISQEIAWLNEYLLLQGKKIGRKLQVTLNIPEQYEAYKIHKLLMQPFIENSLKHGFRQKRDACILQISMQKMENQLHIIIFDNGSGISEDMVWKLNHETENGEHLGVSNVKKRLQLYYGDVAQLYFESVQGEFTKVHLFIPAVLGDAEAGNVVNETI